MLKPAEHIKETCPSCHPTQHIKTLAKFTGEYDEETKEYTYACSKCGAKVWANEQWIKEHAADGDLEENLKGDEEMSVAGKEESLLEVLHQFGNNSGDLSSALEMLDALATEVGRFQEDITNWDYNNIPAEMIVRETKIKMLLISELFYHLNNRFQKTGLELDENILSLQGLLNGVEVAKKSSLPSAMSKKQSSITI